jgi:hypothetical protein
MSAVGLKEQTYSDSRAMSVQCQHRKSLFKIKPTVYGALRPRLENFKLDFTDAALFPSLRMTIPTTGT